MLLLRESTAVTLMIGPFVDETDGVTPLTTLTISQSDVRLSKNGGAFAQKNNATAATHDENGYYSIPLSTTDTETRGALVLAITKSGALPVWCEYMVLDDEVFNALVTNDGVIRADIRSVVGTSATSISDFRATVTSASNLDEVDISGQSVSASNMLTEPVDANIIQVNDASISITDFRATVTSASNLNEVDVSGQSVSANNLSEVLDNENVDTDVSVRDYMKVSLAYETGDIDRTDNKYDYKNRDDIVELSLSATDNNRFRI